MLHPRRLLAGAAVAAAALACAGPAAAYDTANLRTRLAAEMARAGSSSGALVRDLDAEADIYALRPDVPRIPASVEKLYTTSSTLLRLGPSKTLATVAAATFPVTPDGVLRGDLYLIGGGDPFFGAASAATLVASLRAAGVRQITGGVVGDERFFDERRSAKAAGYDFEVGGVLSALAFDRGVAGGRALTDADRFAASRFAALLKAAGIRQGRAGRAGAAPPDAVPIAQLPSMPARELARFVNVPSNNFAAEMLLKGLGARYGGGGTTARGAAVVRDTLDDFGVVPKVVDGSGLSRRDRSTPRQVVGLLDHMDDQAAGPSFRASLAIAGRTGTVKARMRGTPAQGRCRVKTGTLRGVITLAGYCRARSGRNLGFAFLLNGVAYGKGRGILDRMAAALARVDA